MVVVCLSERMAGRRHDTRRLVLFWQSHSGRLYSGALGENSSTDAGPVTVFRLVHNLLE